MYYKSEDHKKKTLIIYNAMKDRKDVELISKIYWRRCLGVMLPHFVVDFNHGKQKIYAINTDGYDCYIPYSSY